MQNTTVTLTRCSDYSSPAIAEALQRQFTLLGGLQKFVKASDSVLLKPNFLAPKSRRHAVQTDPAVIIETAKLLKDFGAKPFVADSPAWSNVFTCVKKLKLQEPLRKLNVPVKQLDKPKRVRIGKAHTKLGISSIALDADVIINLPKLKTHQQLTASFAVKNMFGTVTGKQKAYLHFAKGKTQHRFAELLIEIYKFLNPALTIVDAVIAMEGPGPIKGTPKKLGCLIGSTEPIACETVCAKLINIDPRDVPIMEAARLMRFGCSDFDKINIVGDDLSRNICNDFVIPDLIPVRFSLPHVCKSIAKQIILLAKSTLKSKTKN
ncbi:DUF362 domain-containing protein [Planctomycetota bacterium]